MSAFGDTIKQWFETNDMPNQQQFAEWVDKSRLKDEKIPMIDVTGLEEAINGLGSPIQKIEATGLWQYTIPEGYILEWLIIKPSTDCTVVLNDGMGNDIDVDVVATHGEPISCMYNAGVDRDISIDGLPAKTIVYVKRFKLPI